MYRWRAILSGASHLTPRGQRWPPAADNPGNVTGTAASIHGESRIPELQGSPTHHLPQALSSVNTTFTL